ncbi:MAG: methyltransferase domain-containing protein, partial [Caldilinea sp.]
MYVRALAPYTERISGIDIEQEHLAIAARTVPTALLALAAAEALPFASSTVDLVLSHEVLEHVAD